MNQKRRISLIISAPPSAAATWSLGALGEDFAEAGVVFIFVYVVDADVSMGRVLVKDSYVCFVCLFATNGCHTEADQGVERFHQTYRCKLSGLGYLCSRSIQYGQTYPGDSCTSPCLIISFFLLNPFPPSLLWHPFTGQ